MNDARLYVPIQGGRAVNGEIKGVIGDDTGDNISALNVNLNEMTSMYWVRKHYEELGNPGFVGFAHYRRCLEWDAALLAPNVVFASAYLLPRPVLRYFKMTLGNVDDAFGHFLNSFSAAGRFPEYGDLDVYCAQRLTYCCNLLLTDRNTFFRYFSFIEDCIDLCRMLIDSGKVYVAGPRFEDRRKFGYVLEFMTGYWIWHEERAKRIAVRRACKRVF